jgi:hypothetical protein
MLGALALMAAPFVAPHPADSKILWECRAPIDWRVTKGCAARRLPRARYVARTHYRPQTTSTQELAGGPFRGNTQGAAEDREGRQRMTNTGEGRTYAQRTACRQSQALYFLFPQRAIQARVCSEKQINTRSGREARMNFMFKAAVVILVLACTISGSAIAGAFEDGSNAWDHGDYASAMRLLRPLADRGDPRAQSRVGVMYQHGWGVQLDYADAVSWLRQAADQGDADAQNNLAFMYLYGRGVSKDYVSAHMWFSLAASRGVRSASFSRDLLAAKMNPVEVAKAQRLAHEWKPTYDRRHIFQLNAQSVPIGQVIAYPCERDRDRVSLGSELGNCFRARIIRSKTLHCTFQRWPKTTLIHADLSVRAILASHPGEAYRACGRRSIRQAWRSSRPPAAQANVRTAVSSR